MTDPLSTRPAAAHRSSTLHIAAHLAVWAGLYIAGAVVCFAQLAGIDGLVPARALALAVSFAFCTAAAVYLLDRVKLRDAWLDPADAQAHPQRFDFLAARSALVRGLIVVLLVLAAWLGTMLISSGGGRWVGALVPVLSAAGVLVYAGRPRRGRARPKDILFIKNFYVAAGITGFAAVVALAAVHAGEHDWGLRAMWETVKSHAAPLAVSAAHLAARVFADAVLCDLDDEDADRRHGTGTLPTHLGRARAWNIALAIRLALAAAIALVPILPAPARLAWAGVTAASSIVLRLAAPARVRDWVDARLPIESAMVAAVLWLS